MSGKTYQAAAPGQTFADAGSIQTIFCARRFPCRHWRSSGEWWRGLRNWPPKSTRPAPSATKPPKKPRRSLAYSSAELFRKTSQQGTVPLESLSVLERGKFSHRPRNEPRFFGGAHPWIQIGEIESAGKFIRRWTETLNDDGLAISKKFPKGTVLISIAATIGSVGILDFDCCVPDSIVGISPRNGTDSEFLYHFLGYLRGHLEEIAPQSAQKNINLQILSPLPVPKLALPEQRRIVSELDALQAEVDTLKRLQAETRAELEALLPAILDPAFKGKL